MSRSWIIPAELLARVRAESERPLEPAEFDHWVNARMSDAEREELVGLVAWFRRRYPTPAERLAYARRAAARLRPPSGSR